MLDLGRHATYIWLSYGLAAVVIATIVIWLTVVGRSYARRLAELEALGQRRRSGAPLGASRDVSAAADAPKSGATP